MCENIARLDEAVLNLIARIPILISCLTFAAFLRIGSSHSLEFPLARKLL